MYKRLSRFLQRLKKQISDFGSWRERAAPAEPKQSSLAGSLGIAAKEPLKLASPPASQIPAANIFFEEPPIVPLLASDTDALWLGSGDFRAQEFVRATKEQLYSIPKIGSSSCAEIAAALNKTGAVLPKNGAWDSRLIYHFTRRFTPLRPDFWFNPMLVWSNASGTVNERDGPAARRL